MFRFELYCQDEGASFERRLIMTVRFLECKFEHQGHILVVEIDSIAKVKEGFYIDNRNRFIESLECARYWIPPVAIKHITIL